jgi:hypothetical protein
MNDLIRIIFVVLCYALIGAGIFYLLMGIIKQTRIRRKEKAYITVIVTYLEQLYTKPVNTWTLGDVGYATCLLRLLWDKTRPVGATEYKNMLYEFKAQGATCADSPGKKNILQAIDDFIRELDEFS